MAKYQLQVIFLLEEINRLNHLWRAVFDNLANAENYIEQCEIRLSEMSRTTQANSVQEVVKEVFRIPPEIEAKIAFLAQENDRLKLSIQ